MEAEGSGIAVGKTSRVKSKTKDRNAETFWAGLQSVSKRFAIKFGS